MLSVVYADVLLMLSVVYAECHQEALYAEYHFAECRYVERRDLKLRI